MTVTADRPAAERKPDSRRPWLKPGTPLSDREREVLDLASHGCTNAVIGARLFLTEDTVKSHLRAAFRRLDAHDRAHAVRRGFELGLLTPDAGSAES